MRRHLRRFRAITAAIGLVSLVFTGLSGWPSAGGKVTLHFIVYNHTQGRKAAFDEKNAVIGSTITLNVQKLLQKYSITGVDTRRIVLRYAGFGEFIKFSKLGELSFTVPDTITSYDIYLFNELGKTPEGIQPSYDWMDEQRAKLYAATGFPVVYRKDFDNQSGPEDVWGGKLIEEIGSRGVFDQLNAALEVPRAGLKYGFIDRRPPATSGTFSYGYGKSEYYVGLSCGSSITVNADNNNTTTSKVAVGLMVAFDNITCTLGIGGEGSWATIQDGGVLNQVGRDLFAYVFVKDPAAGHNP